MSSGKPKSGRTERTRDLNRLYEKARLLELSGQVDASRDALSALLAIDPENRRAFALAERLGGAEELRRRASTWQWHSLRRHGMPRWMADRIAALERWLARRWERIVAFWRSAVRVWTRLRRFVREREWRRWPGRVARKANEVRDGATELRRDWIAGRPARRRCRRYCLLQITRWSIGRTRRTQRQPGRISEWLRRPGGPTVWERISIAIVGTITTIDLVRLLGMALQHGWTLQIVVRGRSSTGLQPIWLSVSWHTILILSAVLSLSYGILYRKRQSDAQC